MAPRFDTAPPPVKLPSGSETRKKGSPMPAESADAAAPGKILIYVGDPMCSWCWGFSPVKQALVAACEGRAEPRLVTGGLRPFQTEPNDEARRQFLREHWIEIGQRSGQPFTLDILERTDFVNDTEPSCRAAVTMRQMRGHLAGLQFFAAVQHAYFADNRDITQGDVLADVAGEAGADRDAFSALYESDAMKQATLDDFQFARSLGVTGFPTMVVNEGEQYAYLTVGYQELDQLGPVFDQWLEHGFEGRG